MAVCRSSFCVTAAAKSDLKNAQDYAYLEAKAAVVSSFLDCTHYLALTKLLLYRAQGFVHEMQLDSILR